MLNYTGKSHGDDEPISMRVVLEAVGLFGAIWAIRTLDGIDKQRDEFTEFCSNGATQEQITVKFLELFGDWDG